MELLRRKKKIIKSNVGECSTMMLGRAYEPHDESDILVWSPEEIEAAMKVVKGCNIIS